LAVDAVRNIVFTRGDGKTSSLAFFKQIQLRTPFLPPV